MAFAARLSLLTNLCPVHARPHAMQWAAPSPRFDSKPLRSAPTSLCSAPTSMRAPALQVSAYVTLTDVDPDAPVVWLQPTPNGYTVPAGQGMLPVRWVLQAAKSFGNQSRHQVASQQSYLPPSVASLDLVPERPCGPEFGTNTRCGICNPNPQAHLRARPDQPAPQQGVGQQRWRRRQWARAAAAPPLSRRPPAQPQRSGPWRVQQGGGAAVQGGMGGNALGSGLDASLAARAYESS